MANLQLSLACSDNARTRPIIEGRVKPDGIELHVTVLHPSELFWRQLQFEEFDLSEMSLSSLLMAVAHGDKRWVGIPVFTSRRFFHTRVLVRTDAGIEKPQDLKGKRIGVPEYQQTAALWTRAALEQLYGVRAQDMEWWMERPEERSHGGATGFRPPPDIKFHRIPPEKSIATMILDGELDASAWYIAHANLVDRSRVDLTKDSRVRPLFPDALAEGIRYFEKTGFFPINHGMVMRRVVHEKHPWALLNVFNAFSKANNMVNNQARELAGPFFETGLLPADRRKAMSTEIFPYGVKSNQAILEAIARLSHAQGLTSRVVGLDELFVPQTLDL
jgi:4,5-dihydroxyphthalate decarboxylase